MRIVGILIILAVAVLALPPPCGWGGIHPASEDIQKIREQYQQEVLEDWIEDSEGVACYPCRLVKAIVHNDYRTFYHLVDWKNMPGDAPGEEEYVERVRGNLEGIAKELRLAYGAPEIFLVKTQPILLDWMYVRSIWALDQYWKFVWWGSDPGRRVVKLVVLRHVYTFDCWQPLCSFAYDGTWRVRGEEQREVVPRKGEIR